MIKFYLLSLLTFFPNHAFSFVENVTHGYTNCRACHISTSGGGLLNDYGRSLSKELMSTWSWKNSEQPLFGAASNTDWLKVGGDYRTIQTYLETPRVRQGKQFDMQKNLELGARLSKFWLVGTLGTHEGPPGIPNSGTFLSERHYVLWDVTDEINLRAGKYRLNFGLYDPNHTRVTKQPLGFGPNSESYILEFSKFSDTDEVFISADLGRIDIPRNFSTEKSFSLNYAKYITEKAKIGTGFLLSESLESRRSVLNLYGITGLIENLIFKFEGSYQKSYSSTAPQNPNDLTALVGSIAYQISKGLLPYFVAEYLQQNQNNSISSQSSLGLGVQWLPIPHIEIQAEYKKQTNQESATSQIDSGWALFHFYL